MISKSELRKILTEKRKTIDTNSLSKIICEKIMENDVYKNAKNIFAYYPLPYETDIKPLFEDKTKNWFLPKVNGENLDFYEYKIGDKLKQGAFGVYEPCGEKPFIYYPDLIIVPALSVDKEGFRLGYGKGYYDRLISSLKYSVPTLVPIFSEFLTDTLPKEKHDKKIDVVVTENVIQKETP